jgi:hypothetical protein
LVPLLGRQHAAEHPGIGPLEPAHEGLSRGCASELSANALWEGATQVVAKKPRRLNQPC